MQALRNIIASVRNLFSKAQTQAAVVNAELAGWARFWVEGFNTGGRITFPAARILAMIPGAIYIDKPTANGLRVRTAEGFVCVNSLTGALSYE